MTGTASENTTQVVMQKPQIYVERTLAIIKPDAVHKTDEIEEQILRAGFAVIQVCLLSFSDYSFELSLKN